MLRYEYNPLLDGKPNQVYQHELSPDTWATIQIQSLEAGGKYYMIITMDGEVKTSVEHTVSQHDDMKLWTSDNWYNAAGVYIRKLHYTTSLGLRISI